MWPRVNSSGDCILRHGERPFRYRFKTAKLDGLQAINSLLKAT